MYGKERGHHQAARGVSREPLQNQEQQQRVRGVQQQAGVVMARRIELKELAIQLLTIVRSYSD